MTPWILFLVVTLILAAVFVAIWRYWDQLVRSSADAQAYDQRIARLNERQANRLSDDLLSQKVDQDEAWKVMVRRGVEAARRRDRYLGDSTRRTRERRQSR